ncbi:cation:proton antiporter [Gracilibacillus sp. YIM 98692]|uniref:cation:proton antiporter n=1 Tax=Gracilibacillus sp. YIM 98692 TaxID=2663532 RepID=UPI0013D7FDCB|nr:cation:proton antiporter [Gracilibacillus sp. YIM 98692]
MLGDFPTLLGAGLVLLGIFYLGYLSLKINFPNVILYIIFGVICADILVDNEVLHFASEVGIVLLFFILGLEFSISRLGDIARKAWSSGLLDVFLSLGVAMFISIGFGLDLLSSFVVGGIAYATSSSITAKMLDDKGRMANRETEFILAILIFEDLVAPIVIAVLIGITSSGAFSVTDLSIVLAKVILLIMAAVTISKIVPEPLERFLNKIDDEDFRFALLIGIAISFGGIALWLELSEVLGAFLAGMMLAEMSKIERVEQAVIPIRDLMLPTFFVYFGTTIQFGQGIPMPLLLISLIIWSIIAKILVGVIGGKWYGLSKKVSFRAGLSLCARGEFSVVIASIASGPIKLLGGFYVIVVAFIGMLLFEYAPNIADRFYGKKVNKQRKLKVPGS